MDIHIDAPWPAAALSNFAAHRFIFDGVECASMEGLLQSFKFRDIPVQVNVCAMEGIVAKKRGREMTAKWQRTQILWWGGNEYARSSTEYQALLDRAYTSLSNQNALWGKALMATSGVLTHRIGHDDPTKTILTAHEFCSRLMKIRDHGWLYGED